MYEAILYIIVAFFLLWKLIMVTMTGHIFINILQTEHFSALKFAMSYEKDMSLFVIPKIWKVWT